MAAEKLYNKSNEGNNVLVASVVYLLMNRSHHISRNVRAQWFLNHLNSTIGLPPSKNLPDTDTELFLVSVLPQDPPEDWSVETRHNYRYLIVSSTDVLFFSEIYSTVYCLDMSPSISAVDIQHGKVMLDEIVDVLSESLNGVVSPLLIPGSAILFEPQIFVTVIVHTPFFTTPAQQVLVQGWQVTPDNLSEFLAAIRKQLELLEDTIAEVSAVAYDQLDAVRIRQMESERLVGGLFEESPEKQVHLSTAEIPMVSPDLGFINLLRYGMLALRLLPHSSLSNLVVVTDGVISLPDIHVLDLVLTQLRTNAVAVSFLHVGSQFHPHCAQGLVPYSELMQFISCATFGMYIPLSATRNYGHGGLNTYHEAFLTWSFKKGAKVHELSTPVPRMGEWFISNHSFYGNREPQLLVKKQTEENLNASLASVLCCRLHEGFMIKNVIAKDGQLEMCLTLPWANHIYIEYSLLCEWPSNPFNSVRFSISIKAPYEFLHDITCLIKKPFQSPYRQAVVSRFWTTVKTLSHSDLLLAHLDSFANSPVAYTLPESIRSGMPLYYLPSNNGPPTLSSSDPSCPQFGQFWRPVCLLDPSVWHKWMHTHTLSLILQHDLPLPKYLHMPSPNGRFQGLLCRHAAATLFNFLKDWTTFVLIENHSYLKFLSSGESDKTPSWFYIVRVQQKSPCTVLYIAFLGGTPGKIRQQIVEQLKEKIAALTVPQRLSYKETLTGRSQYMRDDLIESQTRSNVPCCILLNKPLEKILVRYERMPSEFGTVVFPDGTQPLSDAKPSRPTSTLVTTLSRYLHHRRWVWSVSSQNYSLGIPAISRILALLTQMRLQEGFHFAHSTAGIINMVLEVQMKCCDQDADHMCDNCRPSIIQYVLFPIHSTSTASKNSTSEEEDTDESESESNMELIAECWIEPQHGVVARGPAQRAYMENLPYHQLADVIWKMDAECISSVLTLEQLRLMSQDPQVCTPPRMDPLEAPPRNPLENWPHATALSDQRIQRIPFAYNVISVLPESQQIELQFPMFIQDLGDDLNTKNPADAPNVLLMDTFFHQLKEFHDKELFLSPVESKLFVKFIFQRERNTEQHPVPFPRRQSWDSSTKSSGRKFSDKDADKDNEISGSDNKSKLSSGAESGPRKSCEPLYRMYPKTAPFVTRAREVDVERDTPRWRFFVKRSSQSYIMLTFVPASYRDCKALMLGAEPKACNLLASRDSMNNIQEDGPDMEQSSDEKQLVFESTLNPEAKPFLPSYKDSTLSILNCSSPLSNRGWILDNLESASVFDPESSHPDLQSTSEINRSVLDPGSPFRLRASSWEPMKPQSVLKTKKHISPRTRTRSVGAKSKTWNESKLLRRKLLYDSDNLSTFSSNAPTSNPVLGSINVPVYVYGCSLDNLIEALVFKFEYVQEFKDLYWKQSSRSDLEGRFESDVTTDHMEEVNNHSNTHRMSVMEEYELCQHAKAVSQAYNKSFGVSLFKSLHLKYNIHAYNVQTAMEECEESLVEINITEYMQTVCRHLKDVKKEPVEEGEPPEEKQEMTVSLPSTSTPTLCHEHRHLHKLIKNKFHQIITQCFKPVPTNPDYYFCSPNWEREQQVELNSAMNATMNTTIDERKTQEPSHEFDSNTFQPELGEFRSEQGSNLGAASPWEGFGSATTPEDVHTSMLSNMDSDSVSIFPEEETDEDVSPLFLQLTCTIQSSNSISGNCSVRIIPTCLGELMDCPLLPMSQVDLQSLTISLGIVCLTLPPSTTVPPVPSVVPTPSAEPVKQSPNTSGSVEEPFPVAPTLIDNLHHLPDYQHKAVNQCVEEIRWLMQDEIAAFSLDRSPVTEATLQMITDHVATSTGRSSCILQHIPLQFVFGAQQSLALFIEDFSEMKVPGYCLKKENEFFYLVKDSSPQATHRDSQDSGQSNTTQELCINTSLQGDGSGSNTSGKEDSRGETELKGPGWSSIEAWHAEVAQLMEAGFVPYVEGGPLDVMEKELDEYSEWLNDLERRRPELPNFWLIMRVNEEAVTSYFHCRFLELETAEVKVYSLVQKNVVNNIKTVCKIVNQKMLLSNLHHTRMCNQLLEPESVEDLWRSSISASQSNLNKDDSTDDDDDDEDTPATETGTPVDCLEASLKFNAGWFSCPVVWEVNFTLHPRLKTGTSKPGLSRGIQAMRTVLNRFSVNNRKNMFVYQDNLGCVFYLRLYENVKTITKNHEGEENSSLSVSRSSSINSLNITTAKRVEDATLVLTYAVNKEQRPRLKSFGELMDNTRQEEYLTLKVHGISEAGPEVKCELVQVLHNRLDDAVLEVLSVMLARNPMCKLSPEDVHFLQKPYRLPDSVIQFSIPPEVFDNLQAVFFYLRQNLLQFLTNPKYTDTRPQYHLQDYSNPEDPAKRVSESNVFLYNQSPASGNKGMACVAVALLDHTGNIIEHPTCQRPSSTAFNEQPYTQAQLTNFTNTNTCKPDDDDPVRLEFRVWKQGRVNLESLTLKLKSAVRHALWDFVVELKLLTAPLSTSSPFSMDAWDGPLNVVYQSVIAPWMQFGHKLAVPSVSTNIVVLSQRHPVNIILREISTLVTSDGTTSFVYCQKDNTYLPHSWNNVPSSATCLLIARNVDQWRASLMDHPKLHMDKIEPKAQKVLQKFSPLLSTTAGEIVQFVPRQRFLISIVTHEKAIVHTYNWAKDLVDMLVKQIGLLGQWLTARSNLQIGVIQQKMGLFLNQPMSRKYENQANNPFMSVGDLESLTTFPGTSRNLRNSSLSAQNLEEVLRDTRAVTRRVTSSDNVVVSIQQLLDTKAHDKRGHQKKLYTMWQTRGATPNIPIAEDVLEVFMFYSRVIHYCVTPLLFLPRWRLQSASTRDFYIKTQSSLAQRTKPESGGLEDKWHQTVCANFVNDYKQYLQSLGFIPVQVGPVTPKKGFRTARPAVVGREDRNVCYLQKSLLGGILLFELYMCEPFFYTKLHALECFRLEGKASSGLISQFTLSFLDECEKMKVLMHLHSFTYDYHLRTLSGYLSTSDLLQPGYHVTSFLDEFLKYYSKAPNYAYSLVHSGHVIIPKVSTPVSMLFSYLLNHEDNYPMRVIRMVTLSQESDKNINQGEEYVLVQQSNSSQLMYRDNQDNKQVYEYNIVLVVANEEVPDQTVLRLRYFILLTSKREPFPRLENEKKLGKFCTVSTASPLMPYSFSRDTTPPILEETPEELAETFQGPYERRNTSHHIEIKTERVNYLGYYSSHEQFMQQLIMDQAQLARQNIEETIAQVSLHCRTHFLWNKLTTATSMGMSPTYAEFCELLSLASIEAISDFDPRVSPVLAQPISWFQGLIKLLMAKYSDHYRVFLSSDSSVQYLLVLHPRVSDGFVMVTVNSSTGRGELNIVTNKTLGEERLEVNMSNLIEDVINACCFHLWTGIL